MTALLLVVLACGGYPADPDPDPDPTEPLDPGAPADCAAAPSEDTDWDHSVSSRAIAALGSAYHGTADVMSNPGRSVTIEARFVYGLVLKDLEDETIIAWIERGDCEWIRLGESRTDDSGAVSFAIDGALVDRTGAYNFELAVRGDDSRVRGAMWITDPQTEVVIFDVDGTLTTGDDEVVEAVLVGDDPTPYPAANEVVHAYLAAGYRPVYVTGRPMYLDVMTRQWLSTRGFPAGPLHLTDGLTEGIADVEAFKRDTLRDLRTRVGLGLPFAYGNAATDICAYAAAGISPASTFIIGENGGQACGDSDPTVAITDYRSHLSELNL